VYPLQKTGDSSLQLLPLIKNEISEFICKKCSAYESQLKEALQELESARIIIDILQKQLQPRPQRTRAAVTVSLHKEPLNKPTQRNGLQYQPDTTQPSQVRINYVSL
jgi:predicted DsbA family dithiol-disulfide isomerase